MGESLWLAVCPRRDSMAPLIAGMYVDADGLQAWAVALGARDSSVVEVWFYPLASEKVVTFAGPILGSLVKEHQERKMFARLKAKFEPAAVVGVPGPVAVGSAEVKPAVVVDPAVPPSITYPEIPKPDAPGVKFYEPPAVDRGYVVPFGETPHEVAGKINADPDAPFTAVVVDGVVRLHQVVRGVSSLVVTPEGLVGPEFDANGDRVLHNGMKLPDRAGCIDGADYLAQLLRWFRPRLSMSAALTAAREARPIETFTPTETAIRVFADRASALDDALAAVQGLVKEPAAPPVEEPSPDAVAFLATMARMRRAALSEASCLAAARELVMQLGGPKLGGYSTAHIAEAIAERAELLDAADPSASIVGGP